MQGTKVNTLGRSSFVQLQKLQASTESIAFCEILFLGFEVTSRVTQRKAGRVSCSFKSYRPQQNPQLLVKFFFWCLRSLQESPKERYDGNWLCGRSSFVQLQKLQASTESIALCEILFWGLVGHFKIHPKKGMIEIGYVVPTHLALQVEFRVASKVIGLNRIHSFM
eukprot:403376678